MLLKIWLSTRVLNCAEQRSICFLLPVTVTRLFLLLGVAVTNKLDELEGNGYV